MLNSSERMGFIIEYITAYESKIKMANKNGLFDSAKMFELFAIEVCNLWFEQEFHNLNDETANYPYLDLVSEDLEIMVQVSTVKNIPPKIKSTLEKIRDSKEAKFKAIKKVTFFMLSNESVNSITDYSNENKIGNISFSKKDNLITTDDIVKKAEIEVDFQIKLYNLLLNEFESFNNHVKSFYDALEMSRKVGLKNIEVTINGEYEIDRSSILNEIKRANSKFISIQGSAGSGKSALCKKYVENETYILYARAERFLEVKNINEIWSLNVIDVLRYLNGKKIIFFIDALEFIADSADTKFELLQYLYEIASNFENVYILSSCRTSDSNAFIRLNNLYSIDSYEVMDLSVEELLPIMVKYPLVKKMQGMKSYSDLLKSPFYINLVVSNDISIDDIEDENKFRDYIWENIICLKEKSRQYGVSYDDVLESVKKIVFKRAKEYLLGIHSDEVNNSVLHALISEDVISMQGKYIRLKYDIFEDICFENYLDKEFLSCKGKYHDFYKEIEKLGRCVYRRYQIWISNKLFIHENREKFIYSLIFTDGLPSEWKRQTEIGIVKSRFCNDFFEEYSTEILHTDLILEFLKIVNLFAFDVKLSNVSSTLPRLRLSPMGEGRPSLIGIIAINNIFKNKDILRDHVIKICSDYSRQGVSDDSATSACRIMQYYIEQTMKELEKTHYYYIAEEIAPCLEVLYRIPEYANMWIKDFWINLRKDYGSDESNKRRIAGDVIGWTLKNAYPALVSTHANGLCLLADAFWLNKNQKKKDEDLYSFHRESNELLYGLSKNAEHHHFEYRSVKENVFLYNLFHVDFKTGLEWAIQFLNTVFDEYVLNEPRSLVKVQIYFDKAKEVKDYWGNPRVWLAGTRDHNVPTLIGDVLYLMNETLINTIDAYKNDETYTLLFANHIKDQIYTKSNNIAMLTIIEKIGLHFENLIPGYAIDLATSTAILEWDINRWSLYSPNPTRQLLEKQILMAVGLTNLEDRYILDKKCNLSLQDYFSRLQIYFDANLRDKCHIVLDYLYESINNDEEHSHELLQIQKMDLREAIVHKIDDNTISLEPQITGEAKKIVENHERSQEKNNKLAKLLEESNETAVNGQPELSTVIKVIDYLLEIMDGSDLDFQYEDLFIKIIAFALLSDELDEERRDFYCRKWIKGIRRYFDNGSLAADIETFPILIKQLESNVSLECKNEIKKLIFDCLMYSGQQGIVDKLAKHIKEYLRNNKNLALSVFNTIVMLAEDEMNHQKYNAEYLKQYRKKEDFEFVPNMQPKLRGVDHYIKEDGIKDCYASDKKEIIRRFLLLDEKLDLGIFDIREFDLATISNVAKSGLCFEDQNFSKVMHDILVCMIDTWAFNKDNGRSQVIDTFQEYELVELYQKEMVQSDTDSKEVIDSLFYGVDFAKFTKEAIEFYQDIFGNFLAEFFDSHNSRVRRDLCKAKIKYIEHKVLKIENEYVQSQLYKALMLSVTRYSRVDWSKCITKYSFADKQFLNEQFTKFGSFHIKELLETIYQMHMDELLPEIIVSIANSFRIASEDKRNFKMIIDSQKSLVLLIIVKAFTSYGDVIKLDQELTISYEEILEILIDLNYEEAAVLLDEFRVH